MTAGEDFVAHFRLTQRLRPRRRFGTILGQKERGSKMQRVTARSAKKASKKTSRTAGNQRKPRKSAEEQIALHLCYGQIGISAVAAAARYQSGAKNPGYPTSSFKLDERGAAVA
jgi:hypothetical protein